MIYRKVANFYNELIQEHKHEDVIPMWLVCNPLGDGQPLLLTVQSYDNKFIRGIVSYEGNTSLQEINVNSLIKDYLKQAGASEDSVSVTYSYRRLKGKRYYQTSTKIPTLQGICLKF